MNALVGYTGFVGSNIFESAGNNIEGLYNSKNIEEAYGTCPDLLIYSGLRAEKYLANNEPKKDMELIIQAQENIEKISPKKLVLISTIDVFKKPVNVDENSKIDTADLHPYGYNRYRLEKWVQERYEDALIIRLPGLFGKNIKKNFIYDLMTYIPFMLKEEKFNELSQKDGILKTYYKKQDNGFYKLDASDEDKEMLKQRFKELGFSALNFTDSRSVYQFYDLSRLWNDINTALKNDIRIWHPATQPVSAAEVYKYITGGTFKNEINTTPAYYDYKTVHDKLFCGNNGYICDKEHVLEEIKRFVGLSA